MHSVVRFSSASVHLERFGAETAHYEIAASISRTVKQALLRRSHVIPRDENAVGVRMAVAVHVLRLGVRGFYAVIAGRLVRRIPIGHGRAGDDVERISFLGQLRVLERLASFFGVRVDLPGPTRGEYAPVFYGSRCFLCRLSEQQHGCDEQGPELNEAHGHVYRPTAAEPA